jgi:nicotinamide riboside kinase
MSEPTVIAILGAECTGKSSLAQDLGAALAASGHDVAVVPEHLRVFCDTHGRTPRVDAQRAIARAQSARILAAGARHALVIADTTALVTAVYSGLVFGDAGAGPAVLGAGG